MLGRFLLWSLIKTGAKTQKDLKRILRKQKKRFDSGLDVIPPDEEEE